MVKKQRKQFVFSTTDLNWDESTVQVIDEKTGEVHKLEVEIVKRKGKPMEKIFSIRLPDTEYEQIKRIAENEDIKPAHFARRVLREAIEKAIKEIEDDSERLEKNKR